MLRYTRNKMEEKGIKTPGFQMFFMIWIETTFNLTLDTYRFRVMNTHTILDEMRLAIMDSNVRNFHLKHLADETSELLENDTIVCSKYYSCLLRGLLNELKGIEKNNCDHQRLRTESAVKLNLIIEELNQNYRNDLVDILLEHLEHDEFQYGSIKRLTSALITELIWEGCSPKFLHEKMLEVFLEDSVAIEKEKYRKLINCFTSLKESHEIFIRLVLPNMPQDQLTLLPERIEGLKVFSIPKIAKEIFSMWPNQYNCMYYLHTNEKTRRKELVVENIKQKGLRVLDVLQFALPGEEMYLDKTYVYKNKNGDLSLEQIENMQLYGFFSRNPAVITGSLKVLKKLEARRNHRAKEQLLDSLHYLRLSQSADNIETQFLNLWIALEKLITASDEREDNIVSILNKLLPKVIALDYPYKIVADLKENLKRFNVYWKYNEHTYYAKKIHIYDLWRQLSDVNASDNIKASAEYLNPLLSQRVQEVHKMLSSAENTLKALTRDKKNLGWHLLRMYRKRNAIAHNAAHGDNIYALTSHLMSYVNNILRQVLYVIDTDPDKTVYDILQKCAIIYDNLEKLIKEDESNDVNKEVLRSPMNMFKIKRKG